MKTTVDISDALLKAAKRKARAQGVTLRSLIEDGLRQVLSEEGPAERFRLRRASFRGEGRAPEFEEWEAVRDLIYRDREV
jgi:hypothetical protein